MKFILNPALISASQEEIGFSVVDGPDANGRWLFRSFWEQQAGARRSMAFGAVPLHWPEPTVLVAGVRGYPVTLDGNPFGVALCDWLNLYAGYFKEHLARIAAEEAYRLERSRLALKQTENRLRRMCGLED